MDSAFRPDRTVYGASGGIATTGQELFKIASALEFSDLVLRVSLELRIPFHHS
jgi:hypothetical protein